MEALLLYRTGTDCRSVTEKFKYEGVTMHETVWSPVLNFEELGWDIRVVCIYIDRDKRLLSAAQTLKSMYPNVRVFLFEEQSSAESQWYVEQGIATRCVRLPCDVSMIARIMKSEILRNEFPSTATIDNFTLDPNRRCLTYKSKTIALRNKEYELLEFLLLNKGKLITRNTLIENVWDRNAKISSNTLDVHIGRLRKKLEASANFKYIHTVHSIGYRFDCSTF